MSLALGNAAKAQDVESQRPIPDHVLGHERNTIEVFRAAADSVVFVTNERLQRRFRSLNVEKIPQNTGSGIIWDERGHIVTNFHVIQGGPARLVPISRGRSSALVVGQKVLAIGNPFGLDHTLTVGVISALGREIQSLNSTTIEDVIQTDASINPGNSGGPLLDSAGRMIGVNTQIVSSTGQSAGIGFAVPVDTVDRIVPQLIKYGKVRRAGLGIRILADAYARQWGVSGVVVREVEKGSPAARAGLRGLSLDRSGTVLSFDAITAIDEEPIENFDDLYQALDGRPPGEQVTVHYQRDGHAEHTSMQLTEIE